MMIFWTTGARMLDGGFISSINSENIGFAMAVRPR